MANDNHLSKQGLVNGNGINGISIKPAEKFEKNGNAKAKNGMIANGNGHMHVNGNANGSANGISNGHCNGDATVRDRAFSLRDESNATDSCGFHACLVVLASAIINGTIFGVVNSFGVLYFYLLRDMDVEDGQPKDQFLDTFIAGIGSLCVGLIFFCSIFASILTDHFGVRKICFLGGLLATIGMYASSFSIDLPHLYLTYGVILGIGASLSYAPSLVILGHYFKRRIGLANGLVTAGSSLFTVIMPLVLKQLIEKNGIKSALKYLSILMSLLMICSLTFKEKLPLKSGNNKNEKNDMSQAITQRRISDSTHIHNNNHTKVAFLFNRSLWNNRLYLLWVVAIPVALFGYFVPFVHLVKHTKDIKVEDGGEILVTCIGAFSGIGRFVTGPIADISHVNPIILQQIAFISIGILTMLLTVAKQFSFLVIICCGLGIFDGCFISLLGPIAFDLVGSADASQAIGVLLCFCSLPLTVGPPIAAYLHDVHGNYTMAFILAGIPPLIGALLMIRILSLQKSLGRKGVIYIVANSEDHSQTHTNTHIKPQITQSNGANHYSSNQNYNPNGLVKVMSGDDGKV